MHSIWLLSSGRSSIGDMAELRARISLVHRLLVALQLSPGPGFSRASEDQSSVIANELVGARLSLEERTSLVEAVAQIPWQSSLHLEKVQMALAGAPATGAAGAVGAGCSRRPMQHFEGIINYFTESQWVVLLSESVMASQKLRTLLEQAHALGLRCASELTVKKLTAMFLIAEGGPKAQSMPTSQKLATSRLMKKELKALGDSPVKAFIKTMPTDPAFFRTQHPEVYNAVFHAEPPMPMKFSMQVFAQVLSTVKCRGGQDCFSIYKIYLYIYIGIKYKYIYIY